MDATRTARVVVGVNGSLNSVAALHRAVGEARLSGRSLLAVLAWSPPPGAALMQPNSSALNEPARKSVRKLLETLNETLGSAIDDLVMEGRVVQGHPGRNLVETANGEGDILVVGTGRRNRMTRAAHPSVLRYCLRHASCPVLAVPPSPLQEDLLELQKRPGRRFFVSWS